MSNHNDGGRTALAGYLYQIIGALSMRALADGSDTLETPAELNALLLLIRDGELHHEQLGQDVELRHLGIDGANERTLVQFKFSRQTPIPNIGPSELSQIASRLAKSIEWAASLGHLVTGYALVTNRHLSPQAEALRGQSSDPILRQLKVVQDLHPETWMKGLWRFAQSYGAEDAEIERGVNSLVGQILSQTATAVNAPITKADLVHAFTGHRESRQLTDDLVAPLSTRDLAEFAQRLTLRIQPLRRRILDAIAKASVERSLVVLCGSGGCGKSISLWQWASGFKSVNTRLDHAFTALVVSREITPTWIANVVSTWAGLPPLHPRRNESSVLAMHRLRIANPQDPIPLMRIGLDGLDEELETSDQVAAVREVLRCFWTADVTARRSQPESTLIVTCRNPDEILDRWLMPSTSGFPWHGVHKPEVISVGDFSDEELMEAARMHSADVFWRIEKALEPGVLRRTQSFGLSEDASLPVGVAAADEEIVESLKHPVMWGALLELEGSVQASALQGDPQAVRELSRVFVSRFCRKALQRGRTAGLDQLKLETVVRAVAVQSANNGRERQLYMDWIEAAHGTGFVNHFEAKTLYAEAMSAGLILEDDPQHWRWRHSWVPSCLAAISRA